MLMFFSLQPKQNLFCSALSYILFQANLEVEPEYTQEDICKCAEVHTNEGENHFSYKIIFCLLLTGLHLTPSLSY